MAPVAGEGHGVALVQGLIRIQQAPFLNPADLLESRVMNGVKKKKVEEEEGEGRRGDGDGDYVEENGLTAGFLSNEADTWKPSAFETVKVRISFSPFFSRN